MNGKIRYGKKSIGYSIVKSTRRKTSEIQVDEKKIVLRVPSTKTKDEIRNIMEEKNNGSSKGNWNLLTMRKEDSLQNKKLLCICKKEHGN